MPPATRLIRKAYLQKSRINHPDKGGDEEVFKKVMEAHVQFSRIPYGAASTTKK